MGYTKGIMTVIGRVDSTRNGRMWQCECSVCGHIRNISTSRITQSKFEKCICKKYKVNKFEEFENFYKIYLIDSKEFTICDKEIFEKFYHGNSFCKDGRGYIICKGMKFHRLIMNVDDPNYSVDHINGNPLDNRKINLRICKHKENSRNKAINKNNTSGVVGVWYNKRCNKWVAEIKVNYKKIHLGYFDCIKDASKVRKTAEGKYFGEYSIGKSRNGNYIPKTLNEIIKSEN